MIDDFVVELEFKGASSRGHVPKRVLRFSCFCRNYEQFQAIIRSILVFDKSVVAFLPQVVPLVALQYDPTKPVGSHGSLLPCGGH